MHREEVSSLWFAQPALSTEYPDVPVAPSRVRTLADMSPEEIARIEAAMGMRVRRAL